MYQCRCGSQNLTVQTECEGQLVQNESLSYVMPLPDRGYLWTKYSQMECQSCGYVNQSQYFNKEAADVP